MRKRVLLVLGGLIAIGAALAFAYPRLAPVGSMVSRRTPAARPAPTPVAQWDAPGRRQLRAALNDAFAPALKAADAWSLAVLTPDGRLLYDDRAERAVVPASTQKLIVAATALVWLEPEFRFHTLLAGSAPIGDNGLLSGDLALIGTGDPSFRRDDLQKGVAALAGAGLRRISGGVVVDARAISGPEINPLWSSDDANEDFDAPTSGISLDQDTVEFHVIGAAAGQLARVTFLPRSDAVHFTGSIRSSSDGSDDVAIASADANNDFVVSGAIPAGSEGKFWVPIHHVPQYAGSVLDRMLRDAGVNLGSAPRVGGVPFDWVMLWQHRSQPIPVLVSRMLYESNNHFAEQILRTVGGVSGSRSDDAAGLAAERRLLHARRIPTPGLHVVDGSGLARANRVAAITLASLLRDAERRGGKDRLYRLLPQGGRQGTLAHYDFTNSLGRVRAKSGHLADVSALAGYVNTQHHGRVAFAFIVNGSRTDADSAIVRAVDRLAAL